MVEGGVGEGIVMMVVVTMVDMVVVMAERRGKGGVDRGAEGVRRKFDDGKRGVRRS